MNSNETPAHFSHFRAKDLDRGGRPSEGGGFALPPPPGVSRGRRQILKEDQHVDKQHRRSPSHQVTPSGHHPLLDGLPNPAAAPSRSGCPCAPAGARARASGHGPRPRRTPPTLLPLLSSPRARTSSDREAATASSGGTAGVGHGCAAVPQPRGRARASRSGRSRSAAFPPVSPAGAAANVVAGVRWRSRAGGGLLALGVALRPQLRLRPALVPSWWRAREPLDADSGRGARRLRRCPFKVTQAHGSPRTGRQRLRSTGAWQGGGPRARGRSAAVRPRAAWPSRPEIGHGCAASCSGRSGRERREGHPSTLN